MKAAALILKMASGKLQAIPAPKSSDLLGLAAEVRQSGIYGNEPVAAGVLLSDDRPFPVKSFKVAAVDAAPKKKKSAPKKKD